MAMAAEEILSHPALEPCVRGQAQSLLSMQEAAPRVASVFATQQRWLMAHAALAQYFRSGACDASAGLLTERFLEIVERHDIASRNTASAFLKEMLKYDIVRTVPNSAGRRHRAVAPAPAVLTAVFGWHVLHLATLDRFDGGGRVARFNADPALLPATESLVADGLIGSNKVREPEGMFSLFTWVNEGGIVMDRLIVGCQQASSDGRIVTDVTSVWHWRSVSSCRGRNSGANLPRPRRWGVWGGPGRVGNLHYGSRQIFGGSTIPRRPSSLRSSTPLSRSARCTNSTAPARRHFPSRRRQRPGSAFREYRWCSPVVPACFGREFAAHGYRRRMRSSGWQRAGLQPIGYADLTD